ncbi:MAG: hypothetical protein KDD10_12065 [Phaeodactylibacter sp.]|nr:hypothetical protein [Phaeodactylibacter sp.]MCB9295036.1 hypothetical protein [Lewinellaceae bacterium]
MKLNYRVYMIFVALLFSAKAGEGAAIRVAVPDAEKAAAPVVDEERLEKARARLGGNREKYERRLGRLERKMKKRGLVGENQEQDVWNDDKFRLGVLLLLVAIGLGIIGAIISLGGLFSFMAGLFALAGVVLLIWSLVEYYG